MTRSVVHVPDHFICPLTLQIMKDPLLSKYGHSFERTAILEWLATQDHHCPITRQPLQPSFLISNTRLIKEIQQWKKKINIILHQKTTMMTSPKNL